MTSSTYLEIRRRVLQTAVILVAILVIVTLYVTSEWKFTKPKPIPMPMIIKVNKYWNITSTVPVKVDNTSNTTSTVKVDKFSIITSTVPVKVSKTTKPSTTRPTSTVLVSVTKASPITTTVPVTVTKTSYITTTVPTRVNKTSNASFTVPRQFRNAMSNADAAILNHILRRFTEMADKANVTYFMYWGTLVGSYRHHGRMPWDDEVDLIIPTAQKKRVIEAFASLLPTYVVNRSARYRWKFYAANSTSIRGFTWKFPFLDLSFYRENDVSLWDEDPTYRPINTYPKSAVFPLCRRPFSQLVLPAPRDASVFLKLGRFDIEKCVSTWYNHSTESVKSNLLTLPCSKLYDDVPFVFRTNTTHGTNETLKIGHRVIDWKLVSGCAN